MKGQTQIRAGFSVLLAFLSCSCAAVYQTCPYPPPLPHGRELTVISDVDDTIKDTHVKLGKTHIPNPRLLLDPFLPWRPVAEMALLYRHWRDFDKTTFIYVSAGPCCYQHPLQRWVKKWNFPDGPVVLRDGPLFFPPHDYKTRAIHQIIERARGHHFVLVGDSGEFDPECYGELAREFPKQIDRILIREISGEQRDSARYVWDFRGVSARCELFTSPATLRN